MLYLIFSCRIIQLYIFQKLLREGSHHRHGMLLPHFVFVRICIIVNSPDDDTGEAVHQSCCFHLDTEGLLLQSLLERVAEHGVFDNSVSRCNRTVVHSHPLSFFLYRHNLVAGRAIAFSLLFVVVFAIVVRGAHADMAVTCFK